MKLTLLLIGALAFASAEARRVRVRPVGSQESLDDEQQQIEYYTEQEDEGPILVSRQDTYGRPNGQQRYQAKPKPVAPRAPPVQTIRNYNKLNDDGSFTFGYEAADGSFKEETRGTDCVVRGKYGYIDPDGNKREFTYVSGNPCDPNAVHDEEEQPEADSGEENIPKGLPRRPLVKPNRPQLNQGRPTTLFQQDYSQDEEEEENVPSQRPIQQTPSPRPTYHTPTPRPSPTPIRNYPVPTFAQLEDELQPQISRNTPKPKLLVETQPRQQHVTITPRPQHQANPPATTYRPQLTASPSPTPKIRPSQIPQSINLDEELKNFQLEHNVVSTPAPRPLKPSSADPIYTSELVFDPNSGQYNTVVYQQLPQTEGNFNLRGRLQPYVAPQSNLYRPFIGGSPRPQHIPQQNPFQDQQHLFQSQQAALVQQSQELFAQQQRRQQEQAKKIPANLLQQGPQRFTPAPAPKPYHHPQPQPFYFVSPDGERTALASGQIDAFLRGHSIAI